MTLPDPDALLHRLAPSLSNGADLEEDLLPETQVLVEELPMSARAHLVLALARAAGGDGLGALRAARTAERLAPFAYRELDTAEKLAAGALQIERQRLETVCQAAPEQPRSPSVGRDFAELGRLRAACGAYGPALLAYGHALEHLGPESMLLTAIGVSLRTLGRARRALDLHRRALAREPHTALIYHNLAAAHADLGELAEAEAAVTQAITLDPTLGAAPLSLATGLAEAGEHRAALRWALEAELRSPELAADAALLRAAIYLRGDERERALAEVEPLRERLLRPALLTATVHTQRGRHHRAQRLWSQLLALARR